MLLLVLAIVVTLGLLHVPEWIVFVVLGVGIALWLAWSTLKVRLADQVGEDMAEAVKEADDMDIIDM